MAIKILGDIVSVVSEHISNPSKSGYHIFVGLEHYDSGEPVITRHGSTEQLESSVKHFIEGDILVARRNVYLKRAGVVNFEGVTSGDSIVLRVKEEKYKDIIPFILNTDDFWDYAEQNSDGTMSKRLAPDALLEYECNIPENHQSIADKLWAAYKLKVSYKQMITATDEMVKSQFIEMFKDLPNNGKIEDLVDKSIASVKKSYQREDEIEYIDISSIDNATNTVMETTRYKVSGAPSRAQQCVRNGDILVSTVRPVNRNIAVITKDLDNLVASTGFCVLRPKEGYREYLLSIVKSDVYTERMCDKASGGLYPAVNNSDVFSYEIHIPEERVAEKVCSIYKQADKSKFTSLKSQFIEMFGQVSEESPCLNDIAQVYDGTHKTPTYTERGIPFISVENISDVYGSKKYISKDDYDLYKHKPEYGDIFMTRIGSIGKCAVYESHDPLAYYVSLALIKPNKDIVHPKFLKYYIESTDGALELKKRSLLKAFPMKINLGEIGKIKVIVPAKDKQLEFVKVAEQADKSKYIN